MAQRSFLWLITAGTAILLLTAVLYWSGLSGPFVLDDFENIVSAYVEAPDFDAVIYAITHNESGMLGRSVAMLSFVLTGLQYGLDPWGYKFHNLLIHLACGLLIFRLVSIVLPLLEQKPRSAGTLVIAGAFASFWLLHPLLVSTVLYAVQRMTQLAALFSLLAMLAYLGARQQPSASLRFGVLGWVLFPLSALLAALSKETAVLIPLYVLACELLVFRTSRADLRRNRHIAVWLGFFVAAPLLLGGLYVLTHFDRFTNYSGRTFTLGERLLTQIHALFFYVRLTLIPRLREMGLFHQDFPLTESFDVLTAVLLGVLLLMVVVIWRARLRFPVLSFGLAWFLISHLLESTFLPLELVFEHRNYLAAAGLLLPAVYYAFTSAAAWRWAAGAWLLIFVLQTWSRVQEWSSEGMLMTLAVEDHPTSQRARTSFANYLFGQNRLDEATVQLEAAASLSPENAGPVLHLLTFYCRIGERHEELLAEAERRLTSYPASVYALSSLDNLLVAYIRQQCDVLTLDDIGRLINAGLAMPDNKTQLQTYSFFTRFSGIHAFQRGLYAQGVIALREAHELSGYVSILGELLRYQISFDRLDDAEDTLAYIEELNTAHFGVENYLVRSLRQALARARLGEQEVDGQDAPE